MENLAQCTLAFIQCYVIYVVLCLCVCVLVHLCGYYVSYITYFSSYAIKNDFLLRYSVIDLCFHLASFLFMINVATVMFRLWFNLLFEWNDLHICVLFSCNFFLFLNNLWQILLCWLMMCLGGRIMSFNFFVA